MASKQIKIANQNSVIERLQKELDTLDQEETTLQDEIVNYKPPPKLEAAHRYELVAPPNALYSDKVICAFLFCPICVTISGGEFSSVEEAKEHVKYDPLHIKIIKEGGKKFTDRLKCSRCRICGEDIFGGNDIISHLLSDTHRLNYTALHDANNPKLLDDSLNNIDSIDLEHKLIDQVKIMFEEMKQENARIKKEEAAAETKSGKRKAKKDGRPFSYTIFDENSSPGEKKKRKSGSASVEMGTNGNTIDLTEENSSIGAKLAWTRIGESPQTTGKTVARPGKHAPITEIPYTDLKLTKQQKKKGWKGTQEMWISPHFKSWLALHMKLKPDQIKQLFTRFPEPFIYSKMDSNGRNCFICENKFKPGTCGTDLQKMAHVNSAEHNENCSKMVAKVNAMFDFDLPNQIMTFVLCYCQFCDKQLQNWNSLIAHLEVTPGH